MRKIIIELNEGKIIIQKKDNDEICGIMFENVPSSSLIKKRINENTCLLLNKLNPIILTDLQLKAKLQEIILKPITEEIIIEEKLEKTEIGIIEEIIEEKEIIEE